SISAVSGVRPRLGLQAPAAVALDAVDFREHRHDVLALLQEPHPALGEERQERRQLRALVALDFIEVEQFTDLGQREAEALAAQDQLEPHALALAVDACALLARRRQ